jgi:predicted RNA binding protein YcfA (HicA-like mRNA interferase family)
MPRALRKRCGEPGDHRNDFLACLEMPITSTVARRVLAVWLIDHGFDELGAKGTSHQRFRHEFGILITAPGHRKQNLSQKHDGMIVLQLEATGCDRDTVRSDLMRNNPRLELTSAAR